MFKTIILSLMILNSSMSFAMNDEVIETSILTLNNNLLRTNKLVEKRTLIDQFDSLLAERQREIAQLPDSAENLEKLGSINELAFYLDIIDFKSIKKQNCTKKEKIITSQTPNVEYENSSDTKLPYEADLSLSVLRAFCSGLR